MTNIIFRQPLEFVESNGDQQEWNNVLHGIDEDVGALFDLQIGDGKWAHVFWDKDDKWYVLACQIKHVLDIKKTGSVIDKVSNYDKSCITLWSKLMWKLKYRTPSNIRHKLRSNHQFINEEGVNFLISNSKSDRCRVFQKELYSRIIPKIKEHGYYCVEGYEKHCSRNLIKAGNGPSLNNNTHTQNDSGSGPNAAIRDQEVDFKEKLFKFLKKKTNLKKCSDLEEMNAKIKKYVKVDMSKAFGKALTKAEQKKVLKLVPKARFQ